MNHTSTHPPVAREELVDALRGIALFGILAVNIQFFAGILGMPSLGVLDAASSPADHAAVLLTALLLEFKFYPIFCFCFGYGFAIQSRRWIARGEPVRPRFLRRMEAMLFMGVLHGSLLWFGDILSRYALGGFVMSRYLGKGPKSLWRTAKFWLVLAAVFTVLGAWAASAASSDMPPLDSAREGGRTGVEAAYVYGDYAAATAQRLKDYALMTIGFIFYLPQIILIFLMGAIAAQLGVLRRPDRFRGFWRRMLAIGLVIGIPVNFVFAWQQWSTSRAPVAGGNAVSALAGELAPILSIALVAGLVLLAERPIGRAFVRMVAPAGRLALSLYIAESLLMAGLLSGFGLGLGAKLRQAELLALGVALYLILLAASHAMARAGMAGPLETLWRRYTYATSAR